MPWIATLISSRIRQLWYAPVLAMAMGLMMIRMLLMARLLDVQSFAEFSVGMLISGTFCMLGCMGLQAMLQRELPLNLLRGQEHRGLVLAAQCNLVALVCSIVGLLATLLGMSLTGISPLLLAMGILHGLSQQVFLVATVESRSRGQAMRFAQQNLIRALAALLLGVGVAASTGSALASLATEAAVSMVLSVHFFRRSAARSFLGSNAIFCLAMRRLRRVSWRSAITLMAISAVSFLLINVDRWVAANQLGVDGFAHYSFAWIVLIIAQSIQAVINAATYPLLARRFAAYGGYSTFRVCMGLSAAILLIGTFCIVPAWFAIDFGLRHWFPMYVDTIAFLPLFLVVAVLRASDFWSSYLLIIGCEQLLLTINIVAAIVGVLSWSLLMSWKQSRVEPCDVALLAVVLTTLGYAVSAGFAWRARAA